MVANFAENIRNSSQCFKVIAVHGWGDSIVVLHWHKGNGTYKQFVQNLLDLINSKAQTQWQ